jgi:hypothetical protein
MSEFLKSKMKIRKNGDQVGEARLLVGRQLVRIGLVDAEFLQTAQL